MLFYLLFTLAELLGAGICIMMGVWFGHFQTGFAWREDPRREFSYHPLFMSIGLIFLYGNAILMYRIFPNTKKIYVKIFHAVFNLGSLVFAIVGVVAAFDSHNLRTPPITNMYSLHSWVGIVVLALFCLQMGPFSSHTTQLRWLSEVVFVLRSAWKSKGSRFEPRCGAHFGVESLGKALYMQFLTRSVGVGSVRLPATRPAHDTEEVVHALPRLLGCCPARSLGNHLPHGHHGASHLPDEANRLYPLLRGRNPNQLHGGDACCLHCDYNLLGHPPRLQESGTKAFINRDTR